jgi:hypothetical protein
MQKILLTLALVGLFAASGFTQGYNYVDGYTRKDGTRVDGHYRTNPNDSTRDNWSSSGNRNPFTGKEGTR